MLLGESSDHIHKLFGTDVQYEVPRYQRRYVWDKTNWRTLWEDILSQLDPELEEENRGHFTGNIVTTKPVKTGQLSRFEVIDGQQRLTTFQIIFCVIRDICESQGHDKLAGDAQKHLVNPDIVIETVKRINTSEHFPDPTYKLIPTDYDKLAFKKVVKGKYGKAIPQAFDELENRLNPEAVKKVRSQVFGRVDKVSHSILDAYDYFYMQITAYVEKDCDYNGVIDLITSIKNNFNLIHIMLGSSEHTEKILHPEKIFESLNATGRMLSEFDYLRNNLFLRAGKLGEDKKGKSYSDIFYDKYWHFESDDWDADKLDSFFRTFLMAELGPEREEKALKAFDRYRNYSKTLTEKQRQSVKYELNQLKCYAASYKEISDPNSDIGCRMQFYDNLDLPRLDSFILSLKHKLAHGSKLHKICCILESYIVRRLLCANRNEARDARINSYEKVETFFSKAIKGSAFDVGDFVADLRDTWPDKNRIKTALEQAWLKDHNLILYILYRIELRKRECSARTYSSLDFKDLKSLLRIMRPRDLSDQVAADSIGNIMPTTTVTRLLDASLEEKKHSLPQIAGDLILSGEICKWNIDPTGQKNTEEINNRAEDLIDSFSSIWPCYC